MPTGKLDQQIYLKKPQTVNTSGSVQTTYVDGRDNSPPEHDWAEVISQRGGEAFAAARTKSAETIRVRIRYRADVLTTWVVEWMGQDYNVRSVDRSQRRAGWLWFTAEGAPIQ